MYTFPLECCKLQIGCLLVILYLAFIYGRERRRFQFTGHGIYDFLLWEGIACLALDAITAYTVNHQQVIHPAVNLILHGLFLVSIDALLFLLLLYMLDMTQGLPTSRSKRLLLAVPFGVNILIVALNLNSLEYRQGSAGFYSMGISVYTCFAMAAIYILLTIAHVFRRWNSIESHKRVNLITSLFVVAGVTGYQMLVPDSLISSIGTTILVIGAYVNQENPAMRELSRYHDEMVMGFATLIENRDNNTGGHVKRTTQYVKLLAEELQRRGLYADVLTKDYLSNLLKAAPMHDVGKIAVPDAILQKPGKLTPEEFDQIKCHAAKGAEIIQECFGRMGNEQYLEMASQIARYHHEKWNGTGYPEGLQRKEIPLCARMMAIADVFDAVSADRCYRPALPLDQCFEIIRNGSGQDFDPILAELFLDLRPQIQRVKESGTLPHDSAVKHR